MIRHVAMFTWAETATDEQIREFAAQLDSMPAAIPVVRRFEHGDDLQLGPGTADYVLVADFDTVEDYRAYADHPYQQKFVEDHSRPIVAIVSRVQYHVA